MASDFINLPHIGANAMQIVSEPQGNQVQHIGTVKRQLTKGDGTQG